LENLSHGAIHRVHHPGLQDWDLWTFKNTVPNSQLVLIDIDDARSVWTLVPLSILILEARLSTAPIMGNRSRGSIGMVEAGRMYEAHLVGSITVHVHAIGEDLRHIEE